jgi:hypothetical protein
MDIRRFYDAVTRSKVHRSLRNIGLKQRHALDAAMRSTVSKAPSGRGPPYSLPFGFVQSPMLATLGLMSSALGAAISNIHSARSVTVSVYMDDIILSGDRLADLDAAKASLEEAATAAGFTFHPTKGSGPAPSVIVFNLNIRHKEMELTPNRYAEFETEILADSVGYITGGILSYVSIVNAAQHSALSAMKL